MNIESTGNNAAWPRNVPGKPTQVAVFGIEQRGGTLRPQVTFTGRFPDLDKAMYWGAKQELKTFRGGKFVAASRVLWQHDLSPEAAVAEMFAQMEPQLRRGLAAADVGFDLETAMFDDPNAVMRPVDYGTVDAMYVEATPPPGSTAEPFAGVVTRDQAEAFVRDVESRTGQR